MPTIKIEPGTPAGNKRSLEQLLGNLEPLLKPSEVAEYCGVHERTVWDPLFKGRHQKRQDRRKVDPD